MEQLDLTPYSTPVSQSAKLKYSSEAECYVLCCEKSKKKNKKKKNVWKIFFQKHRLGFFLDSDTAAKRKTFEFWYK